MLSQRDAVVQTVKKFFGTRFENGMTISPEDKKQIVHLLEESYGRGEFTIESEKSSDSKKVHSYIVGLLNNHLRKCKELNGGEKYIPANPGTRVGTSDSQIKAMRQLLKTLPEGSKDASSVTKAIETRVAALKAEKNKVEIDIEALPAEFRALVK